MPPFPARLTSRRLILRQWRPEDLEPFAALNADPRVMEFFPSPLTRAASDALATRLHDDIARRGWGFWALELRQTAPGNDEEPEGAGQFIGFTGLNIPSFPLPLSPDAGPGAFPECPSSAEVGLVEIGWRLARGFQGQGLASEAARTALRAGFDALNLKEIFAFTVLANRRSRAVMERIGMIDTGITFHHPALAADSPLSRHCLYRIPYPGHRPEADQTREQPPPGTLAK